MVIYGLYALTCQANIDGSGPTRPTEESASDVSCVDKIKNGDESDVDCGGTMCPECKSGRACLTNKDCVSNICKEDNLKCEEIEIDTDKAVEIALSLHREHSKNRDKNKLTQLLNIAAK